MCQERVAYVTFCHLKKTQLQDIFRTCEQSSDETDLDSVCVSFLIGNANFSHLWEVIKVSLVLSHGNATVEGGFSINKLLLVENMLEKTIIAEHHVHDQIQEAGGIGNINIDRKMLDYVRVARKLYQDYLQMKKKEKSEDVRKKAEKRKLDLEVKQLEEQRKILMTESEEKKESIDMQLQELKKRKDSL